MGGWCLLSPYYGQVQRRSIICIIKEEHVKRNKQPGGINAAYNRKTMLYRQFSQIGKKANALNDRWAKTIHKGKKKTTKKITSRHIRNSNSFNTHLSAHYVLALSRGYRSKEATKVLQCIHSSGTHRTLNGESARKTIKEVVRLEVTGRVFLDHQGSWVSTSDTWMKSSQPHEGLEDREGLQSLEDCRRGESQCGWGEWASRCGKLKCAQCEEEGNERF